MRIHYRFRSSSRLSAAVAVLALAACSERATLAPPRPALPPVPANAWLATSSTMPRAGEEIVISAFARADAGGPVGSFTARFLYDTLMLQVVAADSVNDGAMRAMNPVPGEYRLAGASSQGLPEGLLFRLRARVIDPRGVQRMALLLDELHSTQFVELTERLEVKDGRAELLANQRGVLSMQRQDRKP